MLKILIYDDLGNLELEGETSIGEVQVQGRMSYLDWLNVKDDLDPLSRHEKYITSPMGQYIDIRWVKEVAAPADPDVYSSLEEGLVSLRTSMIDWNGKILRLEAEDFLNKKHLIQFYNIVFEPNHPAFHMDGEVIPEALTGYPAFSHTREHRSEGYDVVFERTEYRMRIKATRCVLVNCEKYLEDHEELPRKLPEEFVHHLFPA